MNTYQITICPKCLKLAGYDDYHEHDGVYYGEIAVEAALTHSSAVAESAAQACVTIEKDHRLAMERRAADQAEIQRMEDEWRKTAPPEQVAALEGCRAIRHSSTAMMSKVVKEAWSTPTLRHQLYGPSPLVASPEEIAEHREEGRRMRIAELQAEIDRFEAEGPAAVSFYRLRDIRRQLAELSE